MSILSKLRNQRLGRNICRAICGVSMVMPGLNSPLAHASTADAWGYGTASGTGKNNISGTTSNAFSYSDIDRSKNFWVKLNSDLKDDATGDNVYYVHIANGDNTLAAGDYIAYKNYVKYPDVWVPGSGDGEGSSGYWEPGGYKSDTDRKSVV